MYLILVGSSSYFEEILLTWFLRGISTQIFNYGVLELILTIDKSRGPNSWKPKISWFMTFLGLQPCKIYLISVGSSSYFEEILLARFRRRISTQIFNFGGLELILTIDKSSLDCRDVQIHENQKNHDFWPFLTRNHATHLILVKNGYDRQILRKNGPELNKKHVNSTNIDWFSGQKRSKIMIFLIFMNLDVSTCRWLKSILGRQN